MTLSAEVQIHRMTHLHLSKPPYDIGHELG